MIHRQPYHHTYNCYQHRYTDIRNKSHSNSTQDQHEKSLDAKSNKLKSQLCKKFMENGYCPYDKKCKFAHGLKELRKNNQVNSKYKTKQCGSFKNQHFCIYGQRCNFIHVKGKEHRQGDIHEQVELKVDVEMELIRTINQKQSKLIKKLF